MGERERPGMGMMDFGSERTAMFPLLLLLSHLCTVIIYEEYYQPREVNI